MSKEKARRKSGVSNIKGVYRHQKNDRWCSKITVSGKVIYLGSFVEYSDAVEARLNAEKEYGIHKLKNEYTEFEDYIELKITDTKGVEYFTKFSIEDFDLVSQKLWHISSVGYVGCYENKSTTLFHRLVMGNPENLVIDHKSLDKLDNRRENLRICTTSQNAMNKLPQSNSTSGVSGVNYEKRRRKWRVRIKKDGIVTELGHYEDFDEAVKVRRKAEEDYFGEFRYTD